MISFEKEINIDSSEIESLQKISNLAKKKEVKIAIFGGFTANIFGAARDITDIDLLVDSKDFQWLKEDFKEAEFNALDLKIKLGRIELLRSPVMLTCKSNKVGWFFDKDVKKRLVSIRYKNLTINSISKEDIIIIKSILQRGENEGKYDLFDLKRIIDTNEKEIDFAYINTKALHYDLKERIFYCLSCFTDLAQTYQKKTT